MIYSAGCDTEISPNVGSQPYRLPSGTYRIRHCRCGDHPGDNRLMEAGFQCAGCGEWNSTTVDESAGRRQSYVEDCQTCCKPNVLQVGYDTIAQEFVIAAALE